MNKVTYLIAALCALSFTAFVSDGYAQSVDNEVFIKQLVGVNQAEVQQGTRGGYAEDNLAKVLQEGDGNDAYIYQGDRGVAEDNTAQIAQHGDDNYSYIDQGDGGPSEDNVATITQNGDDNEASIYQGSDPGFAGSIVGAEDNTATLTQNGDDNEAEIYQGSDGGFDGSLVNAEDNTATLTQNGDDNEAEIYQGSDGGFDGSLVNAEDNTTILTQNGDDNEASIYQGFYYGTAKNNIATLTQNGDDNEANIFQGSGEVFVRDRDGDIVNGSPTEIEAFRSEATISQHGNDHYAAAIQAGTNDMIDIVQSGAGSYAVVSQGTAIPQP